MSFSRVKHGLGLFRCREENRPRVELGTKACEPALHARVRQAVHRGELGT